MYICMHIYPVSTFFVTLIFLLQQVLQTSCLFEIFEHHFDAATEVKSPALVSSVNNNNKKGKYCLKIISIALINYGSAGKGAKI